MLAIKIRIPIVFDDQFKAIVWSGEALFLGNTTITSERLKL
ncbi:hypothetical protein [Pontibacter fetidus]|nr:hypothetical protein [Pontibacter fetidus]